MRRLCSNEKAYMVKSDGEYWVVTKGETTTLAPNGWNIYAIDTSTEHYRAKDALLYFEDHEGKATWFCTYFDSL